MNFDEQQIRQIAKDEIKRTTNDSQFGVTPVEFHQHTGVDSPQIDASNVARLNIPFISRTSSFTSTATPTPNINMTDLFDITGQTGSATFQNPIGNPTNGQILRIRVTSSNSATGRSLTFSSSTGGYIGSSPALPSATTTGQTLMLGFMYDTTGSLNKWRLFQSASA